MDLPRIVRVLRQKFAVSYSRSQVCRLLKALHWTPQMPLRQAFQRDEAEVRHPNIAAALRHYGIHVAKALRLIGISEN